MTKSKLPPRSIMIEAMLNSDSRYEGIFFTAVKTTGIFCRPTCNTRKPNPENVTFFRKAEEALIAGYRPCLRCKPLQIPKHRPSWVTHLLEHIKQKPALKWTDTELNGLGLDPINVRRWFKKNFNMTFHQYLRTIQLGKALKQLNDGQSIDSSAYDSGYESLSGFREAFQNNFGVTPKQANKKKILYFSYITTPLGPMLAMAEENALVLLEFLDRPQLTHEINELQDHYNYVVIPEETAILRQCQKELNLYFTHQLTTFTIPLNIDNGTDFDKLTWQELLNIPYGTTCSYAELAMYIKREKSYRAIGKANGRNRIAIIVPCHRVIGSNGKLVGYGGGQARKAALLELEQQTQITLKQL